MRARHQPEIDGIKRARRQEVAALKDRHGVEQRREDAVLQTREAGREQARLALKEQLEQWKKGQPERTDSRLSRDWQGKGEERQPSPEERREAVRRRLEGNGDDPSPSPSHAHAPVPAVASRALARSG